jgi:hypothetical protein
MGLLGGVAAGLAGGMEFMLDDLKAQIAEKRQVALYEAKSMMDAQRDMERDQNKIKLEQEAAQKERDRKTGLLQEAIGKSNGVGGPGGYDPKAYDNLDEEGKAEFRLNALADAGEVDPAKHAEFILGRHDKTAAKQSDIAIKQLRADVAQQLAEGKISEMEARSKLLEAQAGWNERRHAGGAGGGGGNKANETLQFKIDLLKKSGMPEQQAIMAVMRQNLTLGDARKIVAKMGVEKEIAYPGMSDNEIISTLTSGLPAPAQKSDKDQKWKDRLGR